VSLATFLQKSPAFFLAIIMMLFAYQLALLTWSFVPEEQPTLLWKPIAHNHQENSTQINIDTLLQQHLFGQKSNEVEAPVKQEVITDAPITRLKLQLVGIVAASEPSYSSVIIAYKGQQGSYFIDSEIEDTNAIITHIYQDRIILDVKGSNQTLMLDGTDNVDKPSTKRTSIRSSRNKSKAKTVNLDRKGILKDPGKLTDYIRISPVREDGVVKGYRVKPGKDKSVFEASGLKSGDLATELNGVDLTDTEQAFTLMKEFPTMTDITLSVERDGQLHELYFSIP